MDFFSSMLSPQPVTTTRGGFLLGQAQASEIGRTSGRGGGGTRPVCGVDMPDYQFDRGVVIQGGQGSGKTSLILNAIHPLLYRAAEPDSREKIIITDMKGDVSAGTFKLIASMPHKPPVVILNPLDRLGCSLDFRPLAARPDYLDQLVATLASRPKGSKSDEFFESSSMGILRSLIRILNVRLKGNWTQRQMSLLASDYDKLLKILTNSPIGRSKAEKVYKPTFAGQVSTIESWMNGFETVFAAAEHTVPVNLDRFLEGRGVMIICGPEDQRATLSPFARLLLGYVKDRLLTANGADRLSHTTIVLDELAYVPQGRRGD